MKSSVKWLGEFVDSPPKLGDLTKLSSIPPMVLARLSGTARVVFAKFGSHSFRLGDKQECFVAGSEIQDYSLLRSVEFPAVAPQRK
jgi:hypothetical protein